MQLFLYKKSRKGLLGSSSEASVPDLRLRRSEKMPSSNFFEFLTGRPNAWNRKERHRTMSVPEMWKRLFLSTVKTRVLDRQPVSPYQSTHETYSPVGRRNRLIKESGVQSTGAEIKKYLTKNRPSATGSNP